MIKFEPMLTPLQMVEAGVFGGAYFGENCGATPLSTFNYEKLFDILFKGTSSDLYKADKYLPRRNKFKTRSGLTYTQWKDFGWFHPDDPYGWFEWYCKYSLGRVHEDDGRQIDRWYKICGPDGRWRNRLYGMIYEKGTTVDDLSVSPRIRQTLLHWGYEANQEDYEYFLKYN